MAVLKDSFELDDNEFGSTYGVKWAAMTFTAGSSYTITDVRLKLVVGQNAPSGTITVGIRATSGDLPTLGDLCSGTISASIVTFAAGGDWYNFNFGAGTALTSGTVYAIVMRHTTATSTTDVHWRIDITAPAYADGRFCTSENSGVAWAGQAYDGVFKTYAFTSAPTDKTYSKALVAVGGDQFWYESAAGTMTQLAASVGDINTASPLTICEAYQKIFIANKTNLKVADFINTMLTHAALTTAHAKGDTLTQANSAATMLVDFTSPDKTKTYGYVTFGTFDTTNSVTGSGSGTAFTPTVVTAPTTPHWYNWTVYAGDTATYGIMPTQPTIVCLYRGRLFLSGDSGRPHQWWLTKVGNPFDVKYDSTDQLSGVSGGDSDVGEIGDIVTASIPYKDDLLVIGCANSIWVIIGDPTAGGQLAEVSLRTGIWGSQAWCIDDKGNLYFLGNDGLYRLPLATGMPPPENISRLNLPNLITDLGLDKSLHRVILGYDPFNYGITITRTLLSDGTNTGYWFDLTTQGFYPESYPTSCGVFSAFYYQATDDTYKKYLVGGNDGYIREFDNATENDATTSSTAPINSYCAILQKIAQDSEREAKLTSLTAITAGGASGGDTDSVTYSLYKGDNAEEVLNKITSGATAFATGNWTTVGKQDRIRQRMRGTWMGLKLSDNTASKTWALEKLFGNVEPAGKI